MNNIKIGNTIKELRIAKNISTSDIVKGLTISEIEYIKCENGVTSFYVDDLIIVADRLNIDTAQLFALTT